MLERFAKKINKWKSFSYNSYLIEVSIKYYFLMLIKNIITIIFFYDNSYNHPEFPIWTPLIFLVYDYLKP